MTCRPLLLALSSSALAFSSISCTTTETTDGPQVVATTGDYSQKGEWGGAVKFVQGGMEINDEPAAVQMDPKVDYVDYERGIVNYSFGNRETFQAPAPKEEKEVEIRKIGF